MRARLNALLLSLLALTVTLSISACGDSAAEFNGVAPDVRANPDAPDQRFTPPKCCLLLPTGGVTEFDVNIGNKVELGVVLLSLETGDPMPEELINWSSGGEGTGNLNALQSFTDENGIATVEFRAGEALTTRWVQAEFAKGEDVLTVRFDINVVDLPSGSFLVNVINAGRAQREVAPFDVGVFYNSTVSCRQFNPVNFPAGEIDLQQAAAEGEQLSFDRLLADQEYTILGVGYDANGAVIAQACIDRLTLRAEESYEVDLVFELIPLNPVGTYKVRSYYDLGTALSEANGVLGTIVRFFDGFDNPGGLLYDLVIAGCSQVLPGLLCDAIDGVLGFIEIGGKDIKTWLQDQINNLILSSKTGCSIVRAGCDIRSTIREFEVVSTLYISKVGSDFRLRGSNTLNGIAFYWRWDCDINDPNWQDCGRTELSSDTLLDLEILSGEWEGTIVNYDRLLIDPHGVDLRYGKLIVFIINEVILPQIAGGATNINDALHYWFGCDGFANAVSGISILGQSVSYNDAYRLCTGVIDGIGGLLGFGTALLGLADLPSTMVLGGEVTFNEIDGDFLVDELIDGTWNGTINLGTTQSPISAVWSGCAMSTVNPDCAVPPITRPGFGGSGTCRCDRNCNCAN